MGGSIRRLLRNGVGMFGVWKIALASRSQDTAPLMRKRKTHISLMTTHA